MLSSYKYGQGVDDEEGYKGDINKCFQDVISPLWMPSSYIKQFKEYILKDPEVKAILGEKDSDDDDELQKLKNKLKEKRSDGSKDVIRWVCGILNKRRRDLIKPYLTDEEYSLGLDYFSIKKNLINLEEEKSHKEFIDYLKKWFNECNFQNKRDILYDLWNDSELISNEEYNEIKEYKADDSSKTDENEIDSSDISDIKTKLEKLKSLKDSGLISEEDFNKKKADLLDLI